MKGGADQVYMPTYSVEELITISNFIEGSGAVPKGVSYAEEHVRERYARYGEIFRHVLPAGMEAVRSAARDQKKALQAADAGVLRSGDIEQPDVSHFLVQYQVQQEGEDKFRAYSIDVVNEYIRERLQDKLNSRSIEERRLALIRNDETGFMEIECEWLYESVLADSLVVSREYPGDSARPKSQPQLPPTAFSSSCGQGRRVARVHIENAARGEGGAACVCRHGGGCNLSAHR